MPGSPEWFAGIEILSERSCRLGQTIGADKDYLEHPEILGCPGIKNRLLVMRSRATSIGFQQAAGSTICVLMQLLIPGGSDLGDLSST